MAVVRPLARPVQDCDLNQASCSSLGKTNANAFQTNEEVVGHIPLRMTSCVTSLLNKRTNKGKVVVTGKRVNREAGYEIEIPCEYIFYGVKNQKPWI